MGLLSSEHHALTLLKTDHREVEEIFSEFESSEDNRTKHPLARKAIKMLKVHAQVEEELFYPALRKAGADGIMEEADEEHHVAKLLIAELELMKGSEENFDAKFEVLAESIRHHVKEEESEMFSKAKKTDIDLEALGELMYQRKQALMSEGVPEGPEEKMISDAGLIKESQAKKVSRDFRYPTA